VGAAVKGLMNLANGDGLLGINGFLSPYQAMAPCRAKRYSVGRLKDNLGPENRRRYHRLDIAWSRFLPEEKMTAW